MKTMALVLTLAAVVPRPGPCHLPSCYIKNTWFYISISVYHITGLQVPAPGFLFSFRYECKRIQENRLNLNTATFY